MKPKYVRIVEGGWTPDYRSGVWLVIDSDGLGSYYLRRPGQVETDISCRTDHVQSVEVLDLMVLGITPAEIEEWSNFTSNIFFCYDCKKTYWEPVDHEDSPCEHWTFCEECDDRVDADEYERGECCWE